MDFEKKIKIDQARNLIACGFGLGVKYGSDFYPMRANGRFDCIDGYDKRRIERNYQISAFGDLDLTLYQEDPCNPIV